MYRRSREDLPALMAKMWAIFGFYLVYHHQSKKGFGFLYFNWTKKIKAIYSFENQLVPKHVLKKIRS